MLTNLSSNRDQPTFAIKPTEMPLTRRRLLGAGLSTATSSALFASVPGLAQVLAPTVQTSSERPIETGLSLDGLSFKGPTGAQDMQAHHEEVVRFENGLMGSSECERWGFRPGKYRAARHGDAIRFRVTLVSDDYGQIEWYGEIVDRQISATYHWRKERLFWTLKRNYWFNGTRQGSA